MTIKNNGMDSRDGLACGNVADLVDQAERKICGVGHVGSASFAAGLSRLGERSASRLDQSSCSARPPENVPCVYHSFADADGSTPSAAPFVLVAATHQQAVDHCLLAHEMAHRFRGAVHCLADAALRTSLSCVELPPVPDRLVQAVSKSERASSADLSACFASVGRSLRKALQPITPHGPERARQTIIATGHLAALAQKLVDRGGLGPSTRVLHVQLLRPFPSEELHRLAANSEQLVVLASKNSSVDAELVWAVTTAVRNSTFPQPLLVPVDGSCHSPQDLLNALPDSIADRAGDKPAELDGKVVFALRMGMVPTGRWSRQLLIDSATAILRAMTPESRPDAVAFELVDDANLSASFLAVGAAQGPQNSLDLVICCENEWFDPTPALQRLKRRGRLLLYGQTPSVESVWQRIPETARKLIREREIEIGWLCAAELPDSAIDISHGVRQFIGGAVLRLLENEAMFSGISPEQAPLSTLEQAGCRALKKFMAANLGNASSAQHVHAAAQTRRQPANEKAWRQALRGFHLTGRGADNDLEPLPGLPLWPAVATKLLEEQQLTSAYPFLLATAVPAEEIRPIPLGEIADKLIAANILRDGDRHLILQRWAALAEAASPPTQDLDLNQIMKEAIRDVAEDPPGGEAFLAQPSAGLPQSGRLFTYCQHTPVQLFFWAAETQQQAARAQFRLEIQDLIARLTDLLPNEAATGLGCLTPESLAASMGREAAAFVDLEKLSHNLPHPVASPGAPQAQFDRIRETLNVLQTAVEDFARTPSVHLVTAAYEPAFSHAATASRFRAEDCFEAGLGMLDGLLERMARVFRATRIARLLVESNYQPEVHDPAFARFEWRSCNDEEILATPKVLVVLSSREIRNNALEPSLGRLLRSGRPIQVIVTQDPADLDPAEMAGVLVDLAANSTAHREAFVLQATLAQPCHLVSRMREMIHFVGPAIAFVSTSFLARPERWAWGGELVSHFARRAPCFRYSPDGGSTWSKRLDLSGNPQAEANQAVVKLASDQLPVAAAEIAELVTWAHAAALQPEFRNHFRVIPEAGWSTEQEPIGKYVEKFQSTPPPTLPYIWVVIQGQLCRAILTREMANACRDRYMAWRGFRELAGTESEYANRARQEIRQEMEAKYSSDQAQVLAQGRKEGTELAVNRIMAALLGQKKPATTNNA